MPLLLLVFLAGCSDLFNTDKEDMLLNKIDEQVRWDNAKRLEVVVAVPEGWGTSPQTGTGRAGDTRKGFDFTVEFNPSSAWGFSGWIAVRNEDYNGADTDPAKALDDETVIIKESAGAAGSRIATVTINTTEPVTLVPWCEARPRVSQSNPPLINAGVSYSRGQQIKIWFTAGLDQNTVKFGAEYIEISAQTIGDSSEPYNDPDTVGVNEAGDMTGRAEGASKFFYDPEYDSASRTVTIRPGNNANGTRTPPADVIITVTVGTKVTGANGNGMIAPVSFYYRTNDTVIREVYYADKIWATHDNTKGSEADFFYTGASSDRDRRLKSDRKVTLFFTSSASNSLMVEPPNHVKIVELDYAALNGGLNNIEGYSEDFTNIKQAESTAARVAYQSNAQVSGTVYSIDYTLQAEKAGIIRLIVLPYRDYNNDGIYTDNGDAVFDTWGNANAEGRFAAVVLDNEEPKGTPVITLEGSLSRDTSTNTYTWGGDNKTLSLNADFMNVNDNSTGILPVDASQEKPWTRDDRAKIRWQWRLVSTDNATEKYLSDWHSITATTSSATGNDSLDLSTKLTSSDSDVYYLQMRFQDNINKNNSGNVSGWSGGLALVKYYNASLNPVSNLSAEVNLAGNAITVKWDERAVTVGSDFTGATVVYRVDGGAEQRIDVTKTGNAIASRTITGVPLLNTSGVRSGQEVSGFRLYEIRVEAWSAAGEHKDTEWIKIWNVPEMSNTWNSGLIEIPDDTELAKVGSTDASGAYPPAGSYVLTDDITLSGTWTPVGTNTSPFRGKLYGNGHSITVAAGTTLGGSTYKGLFGYTNNAVIRDLTVAYTDITDSAAQYLGGIAGYAVGSTQMLNVIMSGSLSLNSSSTSAVNMGGVAGYMANTARVENVYGALNLALTGDDKQTAEAYLGGIAGNIGTGSSVIRSAAVTGNVSLTKDAGGIMYAGGIVGYTLTSGRFESLEYAGNLSILRKNNFGGGNYCGGIAGYAIYTAIGPAADSGPVSVRFTGKIDLPDGYSAASDTIVGGIIGYGLWDSSVNLAYASGDIHCRRSGVGQFYLGGLVGKLEGSVGNPAKLTRSVYENGSISYIAAGGNAARIGGAVGAVMRYGDVSFCESRAGSVTAYHTVTSVAEILIGGFAGQLIQADINNCSSTASVAVPPEHTGSATIRTGGFSGILGSIDGVSSIVRNCYATGNVVSYGRTTQHSGGFIGYSYMSTNNNTAKNSIAGCYATGSVTAVNSYSTTTVYYFAAGGLVGFADATDISECYAAGSVNATGTGSAPVSAGGLVGYLGQTSTTPAIAIEQAKSSITNCYALGNVLADSASGAVHAGGLVGYVNIAAGETDAAGKIERNFAGGAVTAQSPGSTNTLYSGGVVGYKANGTLSNNAFISRESQPVRITAKGGNARNIGRIFGASAGTDPADNFALKTTYLGDDASYYVYAPDYKIAASDITASGKNGLDKTDSQFRTATTWTNAVSSDGLGFDAVSASNPEGVWNMAGVMRGYPVLTGAGGQ
ncbi:hypothetical protein AGMMS50293_12070 [Spirochaetia bacterium]|nr:hypothetical protein AGMMS50293_12070 [Spirochaetia bacterium]